LKRSLTHKQTINDNQLKYFKVRTITAQVSEMRFDEHFMPFIIVSPRQAAVVRRLLAVEQNKAGDSK
jgi:hypothetical protein